MTAKKTFGAILRAARESSQKTLKEVSEGMGWSIVYLSDIERDRRNPPSNKTIESLAAILKCSAKKLLDQANKDRNRIEIPLDANKNRQAGEAALVLARRWTELSEEQLINIMKIVKEEED